MTDPVERPLEIVEMYPHPDDPNTALDPRFPHMRFFNGRKFTATFETPEGTRVEGRYSTFDFGDGVGWRLGPQKSDRHVPMESVRAVVEAAATVKGMRRVSEWARAPKTACDLKAEARMMRVAEKYGVVRPPMRDDCSAVQQLVAAGKLERVGPLDSWVFRIVGTAPNLRRPLAALIKAQALFDGVQARLTNAQAAMAAAVREHPDMQEHNGVQSVAVDGTRITIGYLQGRVDAVTWEQDNE